MKINAKINKRVNESVADCRRVITEATVELLKKLGLQEWETVSTGKTLILYQTDKNGNSDTILVNRISYSTDRSGQTNVDTAFGCDDNFQFCRTSRFDSVTGISLSNLEVIYNEVRRLVREK